MSLHTKQALCLGPSDGIATLMRRLSVHVNNERKNVKVFQLKGNQEAIDEVLYTCDLEPAETFPDQDGKAVLNVEIDSEPEERDLKEECESNDVKCELVE